MTTYDDRHAYCTEDHRGYVRWVGDPARGEFTPREKPKPRRRRRG